MGGGLSAGPDPCSNALKLARHFEMQSSRLTLGFRDFAAYFESIFFPQVALFSFFKTKAAATTAETYLKIDTNTVRPSLTEHPVAVGMPEGVSKWGTSCIRGLSVTTR